MIMHEIFDNRCTQVVLNYNFEIFKILIPNKNIISSNIVWSSGLDIIATTYYCYPFFPQVQRPLL